MDRDDWGRASRSFIHTCLIVGGAIAVLLIVGLAHIR